MKLLNPGLTVERDPILSRGGIFVSTDPNCGAFSSTLAVPFCQPLGWTHSHPGPLSLQTLLPRPACPLPRPPGSGVPGTLGQAWATPLPFRTSDLPLCLSTLGTNVSFPRVSRGKLITRGRSVSLLTWQGKTKRNRVSRRLVGSPIKRWKNACFAITNGQHSGWRFPSPSPREIAVNALLEKVAVSSPGRSGAVLLQVKSWPLRLPSGPAPAFSPAGHLPSRPGPATPEVGLQSTLASYPWRL